MAEIPLTVQQIKGLKQAIAKLSSKNAADREAAQRVLDSFGASKFEMLVSLLENEVGSRRKRLRMLAIGGGAYLTLAILSIALPLAFGHHHPSAQMFQMLSSMGGVIAGACAISAAQKNATRALAEFDDKRSIGWWALALEYDDKQVVNLARSKLIQLLPQMLASDRSLMTDDQRAALYRALGKWKGVSGENAELMAAILTALEQIGDEKALPAVEKLANGEGLALHRPELRSAAQECLPALRHRIELSRISETLLRAASPEASAPEMLLRPADGATAADPSQLLRATDAASSAQEPIAPTSTSRYRSDAVIPVEAAENVTVSYRD